MTPTSEPPACPGFVSLVGAGPGDPELLTYRAIQRLQAADLVLHDGLVPESIVRLAVAAECVSVSKRAGHKTVTQPEVVALMIAGARRGQHVVRLKAGDPFVLGRGGEEMLELVAAGVPFDVVPGISSAVAGPGLVGIPVTHRGVTTAFVVVSGHAPDAYVPVLSSLATGTATVVVLMGLGERAGISACLIAGGWAPETPAAIVLSASQPQQRVWTGTLATIARDLEVDLSLVRRDEPGVIVIGEVVSLRTPFDCATPFPSEEKLWQPTTIPAL
ncbi:MAG: uroporphyrinogen-III C-methyltransferase [Acidobacteriota bacterium]